MTKAFFEVKMARLIEEFEETSEQKVMGIKVDTPRGYIEVEIEYDNICRPEIEQHDGFYTFEGEDGGRVMVDGYFDK